MLVVWLRAETLPEACVRDSADRVMRPPPTSAVGWRSGHSYLMVLLEVMEVRCGWKRSLPTPPLLCLLHLSRPLALVFLVTKHSQKPLQV